MTDAHRTAAHSNATSGAAATRADLLALAPDDLATLTNRGTVKRAQKEVEAGEPRGAIEEEPGGRVIVRWSDGVVCEFPAGGTIHDAKCSSNAPGISRHVVRSVLVYQQHHSHPPARNAVTASEGAQSETATKEAACDSGAASSANSATTSSNATSAAAAPSTTMRPPSWDPGQFTDEQLVACFGAAAVARARTRFAHGVLVELTRGAKPTARFLDEAAIVRFPVPGDLRYASADCAESQWGVWVSLAVWSFQRLGPNEAAGLLSLQLQAVATPREALEQWQTLLVELCRDGFAGVAPTWGQRMARLHVHLETEGLAWPADLANELNQLVEQYQAHDARFDPDHAVAVIGESLARARAIARSTEAVPQLLVRGGKVDRASEIRGSRFIGIGLGAAFSRRNVTLSAFVQDASSGHIGVIERVFANPERGSNESPRTLDALVATTITRGVSLGAIGMSQLILQSGKRTANDRLIPPRGAGGLTVNPQTFQWEQLRPPLSVESFAQLRARLRFLPPSYLRPRRATEGLFCVDVAACEAAAFDAARQQLEATLRDRDGESARLVQPYFDRAADGFGAFAQALSELGGKLRFVCGHAKLDGRGLVIRPVAAVLDDDGRRTGLCPWFSRGLANVSAVGASAAESVGDKGNSNRKNFGSEFIAEWQATLGDLLVTGLMRASRDSFEAVRRLAARAARLGFVRVAHALRELGGELDRRDRDLRWDAARASALVAHHCLLVKVAVEE